MYRKSGQLTHLQMFKNAQFCIVSHELHIGRLVWEVADKKDVNKVQLAKAIGRSRSALYKMFDSPTMDTGMLMKFCHELDHNFFQDIANIVEQYVIGEEGKQLKLEKIQSEIEATLNGVPDEEITKAFARFIESKYSKDFRNFLQVIRNENDKNVSSDENEDDVSST